MRMSQLLAAAAIAVVAYAPLAAAQDDAAADEPATSEEAVVEAAAAEETAAPAEVRLYTFQCGEIFVADLNAFSDTEAYTGQSKRLVVPCYLIQHGDDYMIWDAGLPDSLHELPDGQTVGVMTGTMPVTLAGQLDALGVAPADIDYVAISHGHFDHIGNANMFPDATLILQQKEWDALFGENAIFDSAALSEWADGENVEKVNGDYDIFGDGSAVTISLPGHTPGHQALLLRLANAGPVVLSGDWAHFTENREGRGVPDFNTDRADTLASFDRLEALVANIGARLIIEHEATDFDTMPKPPEYLD